MVAAVAASFPAKWGFFQLSEAASDLHTMAGVNGGITGMPVAPSSMGGIGSAMSGANGGDNIQSIMNGTYGKAMVGCPPLMFLVWYSIRPFGRTGGSSPMGVLWCAACFSRSSCSVASSQVSEMCRGTGITRIGRVGAVLIQRITATA